MKTKKYLISAMALLLMATMGACSAKPADKKEAKKTEEKKEENKDEKKEEKKDPASKEEKEATVAVLEEQKALELAIPTNTDADKKSIESKYKSLIDSVKEDKMSKAEVLKLKAGSEKYIKSVKAAQGKGEKKDKK